MHLQGDLLPNWYRIRTTNLKFPDLLVLIILVLLTQPDTATKYGETQSLYITSLLGSIKTFGEWQQVTAPRRYESSQTQSNATKKQ